MPPFGPDLVRNVDYIEPCNVSAEADRFTSRIIFQGELTWSMDDEKADRRGRYDYTPFEYGRWKVRPGKIQTVAVAEQCNWRQLVST